jgi:hypothetical protein
MDEVEKKLAEELGFKVSGWDIRTPDGSGFISNNNQFTQALWSALVAERRKSAEVRAQAMEEAAKIADAEFEKNANWEERADSDAAFLCKNVAERIGSAIRRRASGKDESNG